MVIHRILNNNVVIVLNENEKEQVVCGKGIAYQKKIGDTLDEKEINKVFVLQDQDMNTKFQQLLMDLPIEHVQLADDIIEYAKVKLGKHLNDSLIVSLSDHIYTSIERKKEGIEVKHAMLWDIKRFYEDEFDIGMEALNIIEERMGVRLSQDEAAFIATHIVNAQSGDNLHNVYEITKVMQELSNIVKYFFHIEFDVDSVYYYRFITHLKFFAQRLIKNELYKTDFDDGLFEMVKTRYKSSYECVGKIKEFLKLGYNYNVSDEEMLYLTIHIERVVYKSNS